MVEYKTNLPAEIESLDHRYVVIYKNPETGKKDVKGNSNDHPKWTYEGAMGKLLSIKRNRPETRDTIKVARMIDMKNTDYCVIDIDEEDITLEECYERHPILRETCCVKGTTKGFHFYIKNKEVGRLKTSKKCLKLGGDLITDKIFEKNGGVFNHDTIFEMPTSELRELFIPAKWDEWTKGKTKGRSALPKDDQLDQTIRLMLNKYYGIDAGWSINRKDEETLQIFCDNQICLVEPTHTHSADEHSWIYVNKHSVIAGCYSHETRRINNQDLEGYEAVALLMKMNDERDIRFIDLDIVKQGAVPIMKHMKDTLYPNLRYDSQHKEWMTYSKQSGKWDIVDNTLMIITTEFKNYMDGSIFYYSKKVLDTESEEDKKKFADLQTIYLATRNKIMTGTMMSVCEKIGRTELVDNNLRDLLDTTAYQMAFKNGILNLKTKEFKPFFEQSDYVRTTIDCDWEGWDKDDTEDRAFIKETIKRITNYKEEHYDYLMSVLGYSLCGVAHLEQHIHTIRGVSGANGKSTLFELLEDAFKGSDYVKSFDSNLLVKNYSKTHKILGTMSPARIVWCEEPTKQKVNVKMLKELSNGTYINTDKLYGNNINIPVTFKAFIPANNTINLPDGDGGSSRRLRQMDFKSRFVDDVEDDYESCVFKKDKKLVAHMKDKRITLIRMLCEYANRYTTKGLPPLPKDWEDETKDIIENNNHFKDWFQDHCELDPTGRVSKSELAVHHPNTPIIELKDNLSIISSTIIYYRDRQKDGKRGVFFGFNIKENPDEEEGKDEY